MVVVTMARRHKSMSRPKAGTLGILAFDAGKTMCRLVSLYNSISDREIACLCSETIKSKGVTYLTSQQECFLLNLAVAERLEDLDEVAATVSRLGRKCSDIALSRFDLVYNDLKLGIIDLRKLDYGTRSAQRIIAKMEKLVAATGNLHAAMETMMELEASEKKMQRWKTTTTIANHNINYNFPKPNVDYFNEKIASQRKQVQHYKDVSLWSQTIDKTVGIMARVVCIVYARICSVFGAHLSCPHNKKNDNNHYNNVYCLIEHRVLYQSNLPLSDQYQEFVHKRGTKSGPLAKATKLCDVKFYSGPLKPDITTINHNSHGNFAGKNMNNDKNSKVLKLATPSTVGGAGLAVRYANVILFAERCLHTPATVGEEAREALYEMLPERLRVKVGAKLRGRWRKGENEEVEGELAEGWREAVEELLEWLSPVAHDTVRWHSERHMEKRRFETKATALLLQTLHYSDLEKAEAAIVEVLVGLSCIYWYERR